VGETARLWFCHFGSAETAALSIAINFENSFALCYNPLKERIDKSMDDRQEDSQATNAQETKGDDHALAVELTYRFMYDLVVKMVFSKNPELLKNLVAKLLKINPASISKFLVTNAEIVPDSLGKKFCRLDIAMEVDGRKVTLEVQIKNEKDYVERSTFYLAREYSSALKSGGKYTDLPETVIISIIDFVQFEDSPEEYYSEFKLLEVKRHEVLTEKLRMIYCELPKLPGIAKICGEGIADFSDDEILMLWLSLFKAKTEEDISEIEDLGVDFLSEAVAAYRSVTASEEFKHLEWEREKARYNEAAAVYNAEMRGEKRGAENEREKWQSVVAEQDAALAEKDSALAEQGSALAEKDAALAKQEALIAKLQAMVDANSN
jgi:predicted transposase/invertase (TIGR01784 family)